MLYSFSQYSISQWGSPGCGSLEWLSGTYGSKVNPVSSLNAEKRAVSPGYYWGKVWALNIQTVLRESLKPLSRFSSGKPLAASSTRMCIPKSKKLWKSLGVVWKIVPQEITWVLRLSFGTCLWKFFSSPDNPSDFSTDWPKVPGSFSP